MSKRDYYEVLGVSRTATDPELKSAYRHLALQHHPDRNPGDPTAEEKFKEINEAYGVLSNPETRARYDRYGHAGVGASAGSGAWAAGLRRLRGHPRRSLRRPLRRAPRAPRRRPARRRPALRPRDHSRAGGRRLQDQLDIPRLENCETCHGTGAAPGTSPVDLQSLRRRRPGPLPAGLLLRQPHLPSVPRRPAE